MDQDRQLARIIYHKWLSNMKFTLDLEEYSYKDKGRNDPRYRFFKKSLMANTYETLRTLFEELANMGVIDKTDDDEDVKHGYQSTSGGGSGYINSEDFDEWIKDDLAEGNK